MVGDWYESYELLWHNEESEKIYPFEIKLDRLVIGDVEFNAIRERLEFSRPHHKKPGIVLMGMGIGSSNFGRPIPEGDKDAIYSEMSLGKRLVDDSTFYVKKIKSKITETKSSKDHDFRNKEPDNSIKASRNRGSKTHRRQSDVDHTVDNIIDGIKMVFNNGIKLSRIDENRFRKESEIEKMISSNFSVIFPCLDHLQDQFSIKIPNKNTGFRFDTLAFDREKNCFVVIEYKKKLDRGLINQILGYRATITTNKYEYMIAHRNKLPSHKYNWDLTYMIVISPEYTEKQMLAIEGLGDDNIIKMYEIRKFGNSIVTLDRIKGTPICDGNTTDGRFDPKDSNDNDSDVKVLLKKFEKLVNDVKYVERRDLKGRISYKTLSGRNICVIMKSQKRFKLYYGIRERDGVLEEDGFIKYDKDAPRKFGTGQYWSLITTSTEVDSAFKLFKKVQKFLSSSKRRGPRYSDPYS